MSSLINFCIYGPPRHPFSSGADSKTSTWLNYRNFLLHKYLRDRVSIIIRAGKMYDGHPADAAKAVAIYALVRRDLRDPDYSRWVPEDLSFSNLGMIFSIVGRCHLPLSILASNIMNHKSFRFPFDFSALCSSSSWSSFSPHRIKDLNRPVTRQSKSNGFTGRICTHGF